MLTLFNPSLRLVFSSWHQLVERFQIKLGIIPRQVWGSLYLVVMAIYISDICRNKGSYGLLLVNKSWSLSKQLNRVKVFPFCIFPGVLSEGFFVGIIFSLLFHVWTLFSQMLLKLQVLFSRITRDKSVQIQIQIQILIQIQIQLKILPYTVRCLHSQTWSHMRRIAEIQSLQYFINSPKFWDKSDLQNILHSQFTSWIRGSHVHKIAHSPRVP